MVEADGGGGGWERGPRAAVLVTHTRVLVRGAAASESLKLENAGHTHGVHGGRAEVREECEVKERVCRGLSSILARAQNSG